jgi:hypothetical protein
MVSPSRPGLTTRPARTPAPPHTGRSPGHVPGSPSQRDWLPIRSGHPRPSDSLHGSDAPLPLLTSREPPRPHPLSVHSPCPVYGPSALTSLASCWTPPAISQPPSPGVRVALRAMRTRTVLLAPTLVLAPFAPEPPWPGVRPITYTARDADGPLGLPPLRVLPSQTGTRAPLRAATIHSSLPP